MPARVVFALALVTACALAAVVGVVLADGGNGGEDLEVGASGFAGSVRPSAARAPDFRLSDQDGEPATMAQYRGKTVIVTFAYSTCEDTCPLQVQQIRGALDRLGRDVPVLAISVDPAGDTPERARRFVLEQKMTGRMRFLLGDRAALQPIWKRYGIAPQRGNLDHSAYVVVVDERARQRVGFPFSQLTPERLAHDVERLLTRRS
jgi:protein SCO1/2